MIICMTHASLYHVESQGRDFTNMLPVKHRTWVCYASTALGSSHTLLFKQMALSTQIIAAGIS